MRHRWLAIAGAVACTTPPGAGGKSRPDTARGDTGRPAPAELSLAVGPPLTVSLTAALGAPAAATATAWTLVSETAPGVDCSALLTETGPTQATVRLPGTADTRCADRLRLAARLADGGTRSTTLAVVPTPGRVDTLVPAPANPQPPIGGCPSWHCLGHTDPTLGRLPDGRLALWAATSGIPDDEADLGLPVVGRFVRESDGSWTADEAPGLAPSGLPADHWARARETPSVRWNAEAGAWDLWFLGYRESYFTDPAIGQVRSLDAAGTRWTTSAAPIYRPSPGAWDESFLTSPGALRGPDGLWRIYYAGASFAVEGGRMKVGVLTSTDGLTWERPDDNIVFAGASGSWYAGILDPHVQFVGGRYVMWFTGYVPPLDVDSDAPISVGVAVSEDGFDFTPLHPDPVLEATPDSWNDRRVLDVEALVEEDGSLTLVGYGLSATVPHPHADDVFPARLGLWTTP